MMIVGLKKGLKKWEYNYATNTVVATEWTLDTGSN